MLHENVISRMILGHAPYIRVEHISEKSGFLLVKNRYLATKRGRETED